MLLLVFRKHPPRSLLVPFCYFVHLPKTSTLFRKPCVLVFGSRAARFVFVVRRRPSPKLLPIPRLAELLRRASCAVAAVRRRLECACKERFPSWAASLPRPRCRSDPPAVCWLVRLVEAILARRGRAFCLWRRAHCLLPNLGDFPRN